MLFGRLAPKYMWNDNYADSLEDYILYSLRPSIAICIYNSYMYYFFTVVLITNPIILNEILTHDKDYNAQASAHGNMCSSLGCV